LSTALVVDASVGIQIVVEEHASETIKTLLGENGNWHPLIAPSIVVSEAVAAITKKVRRKELSDALARAAFLAWRDIVEGGLFALTPANDLLDAAFALSLRLHHPLHDCLYLALAQTREAAIATCDGVLARKARELGLAVELISA
jgi:predicted nucleic acid-binding protein